MFLIVFMNEGASEVLLNDFESVFVMELCACISIVVFN